MGTRSRHGKEVFINFFKKFSSSRRMAVHHLWPVISFQKSHIAWRGKPNIASSVHRQYDRHHHHHQQYAMRPVHQHPLAAIFACLTCCHSLHNKVCSHEVMINIQSHVSHICSTKGYVLHAWLELKWRTEPKQRSFQRNKNNLHMITATCYITLSLIPSMHNSWSVQAKPYLIHKSWSLSPDTLCIIKV